MAAGPAHPDSAMLVSGPRGSGKTALLGAMHDIATGRGWIVAHATASSDSAFAGLLADKMILAVRSHAGGKHRRRLSSAQLGAFGLSVGLGLTAEGLPDPMEASRMFRVMDALADAAEAADVGALVTIDEFHNADPAAARSFAHSLQELAKLRERPILFAGAGLPMMEHTILQDPGMTFFQRIARTPLEPLSEIDTEQAIALPISEAGSRIDTFALIDATTAASGYPFMVQLVGYHSWERCPDLSPRHHARRCGAGDRTRRPFHGGTDPAPRVARPVGWRQTRTHCHEPVRRPCDTPERCGTHARCEGRAGLHIHEPAGRSGRYSEASQRQSGLRARGDAPMDPPGAWIRGDLGRHDRRISSPHIPASPHIPVHQSR